MLFKLTISAVLIGLSLLTSSFSYAFSLPQPEQDQVASKVNLIEFQAQNGEPNAQYILGLMRLTGRFVSADSKLGLHWLTLSAKQGNEKASKILGDVYFDGELVERNLSQAEHWYQSLAAIDDPSVQTRLGYIYASGGSGVSRDCGKAISAFATVGNNQAKSNMAWIMATCPESKFRNGQQALKINQELLKEDRNNPSYLDNLAAAYAEVGDFDAAVDTQKNALKALSQSALNSTERVGFEQRLEMYQRGKPYREVVVLISSKTESKKQ